jgi:hypothetical protein
MNSLLACCYFFSAFAVLLADKASPINIRQINCVRQKHDGLPATSCGFQLNAANAGLREPCP